MEISSAVTLQRQHCSSQAIKGERLLELIVVTLASNSGGACWSMPIMSWDNFAVHVCSDPTLSCLRKTASENAATQTHKAIQRSQNSQTERFNVVHQKGSQVKQMLTTFASVMKLP